jgi:hypothetical protein
MLLTSKQSFTSIIYKQVHIMNTHFDKQFFCSAVESTAGFLSSTDPEIK